MRRLSNILPKDFTESQQKLFESITGGKRGQASAVETFLNPEGGLRGPFNALLYCPILGEASQRLGEAVRFEGTLLPQLRELAILTVLWRRGPSTVREVMEELSRHKPTGYTTVLKLLQIMVEKSLVTRDDSGRSHVYQPTAPATFVRVTPFCVSPSRIAS